MEAARDYHYIVLCGLCTLFLNYNIDVASIENNITSTQVRVLYEAQLMSGKVVCSLCGGSLLATSVIMLFFYIKQYIDSHKKQIGILKAIGYSGFKIAKGFSAFGLCILFGAGGGMLAAYGIMPYFYKVQNEDNILPEFPPYFADLPGNCTSAFFCSGFCIVWMQEAKCTCIGIVKGKNRKGF